MTDCRKIQADLKAYLDRELPFARSLTVRLHLAHCEACRKELRAMEQISDNLKAGDEGNLGPDLRARILSGIPDGPAASPARPRFAWRDLLPRRGMDRAQKRRWWGAAAMATVAYFLLFAIMYPVFMPGAREKARIASALPSMSEAARRPATVAQYPAQGATPQHAFAAPQLGAIRGRSGRTDVTRESETLTPPTPAHAMLRQQDYDEQRKTLADRDARSTVTWQIIPNDAAAAQPKGYLRMGGDSNPLPVMPAPKMAKVAGRSAAPAGASTGLTASERLDALAQSERKVHKSADITIGVDKIEVSSEAVTTIITTAGGYIAENQLSTGEDNEKTASLTTRVPVAQFESVLGQLAHLGEVTAKNVTGEDITEKMSDEAEAENVLQSDIKETQAKLRQGESRPQRIEDARTLRELRIRNAQSEARLRLLKRLSVMSEITVQLNEKAKNPGVKTGATGGFWDEMSDTAHDAGQTFMQAVRLPIMLLVWLLVYAPVWLLLMLGYRYAVKR